MTARIKLAHAGTVVRWLSGAPSWRVSLSNWVTQAVCGVG
jgi:hypothetical protein